jgi:two-component system, NtrC family, response regulator AtoC
MSRRILIVDDDEAMRDMLCARLARRDFDVAAVESCDAAIDRLGTARFDVVVTDIRMRGPSGIDLCEWLTANRPDVPAVVITAFGSLDAAMRRSAPARTTSCRSRSTWRS